jgi:lysophospholipase L1-like esterase
MKPIKVVSFLTIVFAMLLGIMVLFPNDGIKFSDNYKLDFPGIAEFFIPDTTSKKDLSHLFVDIENTEETAITPVLETSASERFKNELEKRSRLDSLRRHSSKIQYPNGDWRVLNSFFEKLEQAGTRKVRISHYGDSQIEGDRITGYVRNELQTKFGGDGPGLFPVIAVAPMNWAKNSCSDNWKRYAGFGKIDNSIQHKKYGALLSMCRYAPMSDSITDSSPMHSAWFEVNPRFSNRATIFREFTMYYNNCQSPVAVKVYNGENLHYEDSLKVNDFGQLKLTFNTPAPSVRVTFNGKSSPDVLGMSINSATGVIADNIPLRGASGTEFSKQDKVILEKMLRSISPDLLILQFGGNVLPYVDHEDKAKNYGKWLSTHIQMLKKMVPDAQVLVIGPADMSVKDGEDYVSHPFMEHVRDAVRDAAFSSGAAFWDMYEAMGGKNSMPIWVNSNPPLGAYDYIHFSPKGANKIAQLFYQSLIHDYNTWKNIGINNKSAQN